MIEAASATAIGPKHRANEDSAHVDVERGLFIIADGMGGQNAGDVASQMTIDTVSNFIGRSHDTDEISWPFGVEATRGVASNRLLTAIRLANRRVWKESEDKVEHLGMGSTVVAALLDGHAVALCSAGDSRAYRVADGAIEQITEDDSWVHMAVSQGLIEPGDGESHPLRNVITSAIGAEKKIDPQVEEFELAGGATLLLCSDGLYKVLDEETMLAQIQDDSGDLQKTADRLVQMSVDGGANDDVTVLLIRRIQG